MPADQPTRDGARRLLAGYLATLYANATPRVTCAGQVYELCRYARTADVEDLELATIADDVYAKLVAGESPALVFPELGVSVFPPDASDELVTSTLAVILEEGPAGVVTEPAKAVSSVPELEPPVGPLGWPSEE